VTWRELVGDGQLAKAMEMCEETGWEALPLAPKELTRLFPGLWRTRKAAEDWARKNPLRSLISIIRVWGVLNTYRPPRQTSWSKTLVRHGADARVALAGVLGVGAEDILVRNRDEEGLVPGAQPDSPISITPQRTARGTPEPSPRP
jgi:hypothetical protein